MKFSDEILALFQSDIESVYLTERYQIAIFGSRKLNAVLCNIWIGEYKVRRIEAIIIAEQESIMLVLDGTSSLTIPLGSFPDFVRFISQALVP